MKMKLLIRVIIFERVVLIRQIQWCRARIADIHNSDHVS